MSNRYGAHHPQEYLCKGCGRVEEVCSQSPCLSVLKDRQEENLRELDYATNSSRSGHNILLSIESALSAYINTLDPNSELYAWLDHTNCRLVKARAMIKKEESKLIE